LKEGVTPSRVQRLVRTDGARLDARGIVRKLNGEISAILALADVREILARQGCLPPEEPERLSRLVGTELERWSASSRSRIRAD